MLLLLIPFADADIVTLGKIKIDSEQKAVSFPIYANLEQGIIEFSLVHKNGKIHESLFYTEVTGSELNAALLLLGLKSEFGEQSALPALEDLSQRPALHLEILTPEHTYSMRDFIKYTLPEDLPDTLQWAYTGSFFTKGRYTAETEGDLIAIYSTPYAIINLNHKSRQDDTVWLVEEGNMLPNGTACELLITLGSK